MDPLDGGFSRSHGMPAVPKDLGGLLQQLFLPVLNLIRMDILVVGELG